MVLACNFAVSLSFFLHKFVLPKSVFVGDCRSLLLTHLNASDVIWHLSTWLTHWGWGKNGRQFADNIFKCIFLNENVWISIEISLMFVPNGQICNMPALVQIMAWCWPGNKPLSAPMMISLLTHICITQPQWARYWLCAKEATSY